MPTGQMFINGKWQAPLTGETYAPINPATEEALTPVAKGATSMSRWPRPARPSTRARGLA